MGNGALGGMAEAGAGVATGNPLEVAKGIAQTGANLFGSDSVNLGQLAGLEQSVRSIAGFISQPQLRKNQAAVDALPMSQGKYGPAAISFVRLILEQENDPPRWFDGTVATTEQLKLIQFLRDKMTDQQQVVGQSLKDTYYWKGFQNKGNQATVTGAALGGLVGAGAWFGIPAAGAAISVALPAVAATNFWNPIGWGAGALLVGSVVGGTIYKMCNDEGKEYQKLAEPKMAELMKDVCNSSFNAWMAICEGTRTSGGAPIFDPLVVADFKLELLTAELLDNSWSVDWLKQHLGEVLSERAQAIVSKNGFTLPDRAKSYLANAVNTARDLRRISARELQALGISADILLLSDEDITAILAHAKFSTLEKEGKLQNTFFEDIVKRIDPTKPNLDYLHNTIIDAKAKTDDVFGKIITKFIDQLGLILNQSLNKMISGKSGAEELSAANDHGQGHGLTIGELNVLPKLESTEPILPPSHAQRTGANHVFPQSGKALQKTGGG